MEWLKRLLLQALSFCNSQEYTNLEWITSKCIKNERKRILKSTVQQAQPPPFGSFSGTAAGMPWKYLQKPKRTVYEEQILYLLSCFCAFWQPTEIILNILELKQRENNIHVLIILVGKSGFGNGKESLINIVVFFSWCLEIGYATIWSTPVSCFRLRDLLSYIDDETQTK